MYSLNQVNKLVSCGRDPARSLPLWRGFLLIPLILVCFAFAPQTRALVRYALETNDPWLPELVRRIDGGETVGDDFFVSTPEPFADQSSEEKIGTMSRLICRAGDEPETKAAALLILMWMIENSNHPKTLANEVKHFAFARCGELNLCGMVEAQVAVLENELSAGHKLVS